MVESGFERRASILLVPQLRARDIHPKAKPAALGWSVLPVFQPAQILNSCIETEGEFDTSKLQLDFMMVLEECIQLVTGASYNGEKLQPVWLDDYTCCDSPWRTPQEFAVV